MEKIKIALIGAGYISDYHARALKKLDEVEISSVVGLPLKSAQEFADKYDISEAEDNVQPLYARNDLDAVIISTPNKFHAPFAEEFLKNGKDVFIEKPMAVNPDEGIKIRDMAVENKRLVMVGHMWRFDEEVNFIKHLVQTGKLGKIVKTKGYGIHENWGPSGWFTEKDAAGGGALADMGVHAIDTVRYILGDPKPLEVYAKIGTHYGNYDVDDTGIIIITWDNGTTSIIESGWWQPHMDGPEAGTQIFGIDGYASVFPTEVKLKSEEVIDIPKIEKKEHCDQSIYDAQMKYFIECIKNNKPPVPGLVEGQIIIEIVEAAYKSSELGQIIKF